MLKAVTRQKYQFSMGFILVFALIFFGAMAPLTAAADDARVAELKKKAREEGKLIFYTSLALPDAMALGEKLKKEYPFFKTQVNRLSNTKLLNRVLAEQRAKKKLVDVITCKGDAIHFHLWHTQEPGRKSGKVGLVMASDQELMAGRLLSA